MSLAFTPIYLKLLGIEAFGLVGFSVTLNAVLNVLDMGLSATMNREMARLSTTPNSAQATGPVAEPGVQHPVSLAEEQAQEARDLIRTLEFIYWPIGLVIAGGIGVLAPLIAHRWIQAERLSPAAIQQAVWMMGLAFALQWPYTLYEGGLLGLQRQVLLNGISTVSAILRNAGVVVVLLFSPTIQAFFAWQIVVYAATTLMVCLCFWKSLPTTGHPARFDSGVLRKIRRFALGMTGITVVALILMQLDKVVLSHVLPLKMLGYYSLAYTVASALYNGVIPFYNAFFPRFVQMSLQQDRRALAELYHRGCQAVSVLVLPIAVIMMIFSREMLQLWTHDATTTAQTYRIVSWLVGGFACSSMMSLPYALQLAYGWTKLTLYENLVWVALLVPLLLTLTRLYGAVGAAVAWLLLNASHLFIIVPLMHRRLLPGELWRWYGRDVGLPLLAALLVALVARLWRADSAPALMLVRLALTWGAAALAAAYAAPHARALMQQRLSRGWR